MDRRANCRNPIFVSRRKALHGRLKGVVLPVFARRVLPFVLNASRAFADLMSKAEIAGHAINMADATIASIAAAWGFVVASRDAAPFQAAEAPIINPWAAVP